MIIRGKQYEVHVDGSKEASSRRAVYYIASASPTPEQLAAIDRCEYGLHGGWGNVDPYHIMRNVEYIGIGLNEEELGPDGKWYMMENPDEDVYLMKKGAL